MSFVPNLSLFLTLIIFICLGFFSLHSSRYWKILRIYLSLELHLQRIKSPILKLSKSGGEDQRALVDNFVS